MSSFGFRCLIFFVILFVSPVFVASGFAGHSLTPGQGLSSLTKKQRECRFNRDARNLGTKTWTWCQGQDKRAQSACLKIAEDALHHYINRCVAGARNPHWSKTFGDVQRRFLNQRRTRTTKPVPRRRKTANTNIPLNSKRTIRSIQRRLLKLGYRTGPIDGKMGRRTRAAIRSYQRRHKLSITGRPNRQLLAALGISSSAKLSRSSRRSSRGGGTKRRDAERGKPFWALRSSSQRHERPLIPGAARSR